MLAAHPAKVTVRVLGLAASAASVIAMAGDEIEMGAGSFLMIHNAWAIAIGNRHDLESAAATLAPFDASMAQLYAARTGKTEKEAAKLMDAETWIAAQSAVDQGFADRVINLPDPPAGDGKKARSALAEVDTILAKSHMPRSERRRLLRELTGMPSAAEFHVTPRADETLVAGIEALTRIIQSEK